MPDNIVVKSDDARLTIATGLCMGYRRVTISDPENYIVMPLDDDELRQLAKDILRMVGDA